MQHYTVGDIETRPAASAGGRRAVAGTVAVSVIANDPITGEGTIACLRTYTGLKLLSADERPGADVILMLANEVTENTMQVMETVADRSSNPGMGIVLVTERLRDQHVMRAFQCGLRGVMSRQVSGFNSVVEAVREVGTGGAYLPPPLQGWLVDRLQSIQRDVLAPLGMTASGLETREVAVLRLLAEGMDTTEIAEHLSYSERTIKNIISGMMTRLGLRNRTQAVAHALRSGAL
ncbi:response regulator transcription factor [Streptomyces sp. SID12488]|uniref:response regulator transcription factor n=1 Tax=Streptomyces sp. SID12488 TaxID=2706040 RepID=UPI0013DA144D|nr:response regulator transcription factor [Streptomyces sp. SID12488]NEA68783.1 response regulator transcription factor [Streptomyces sp. SID12488]